MSGKTVAYLALAIAFEALARTHHGSWYTVDMAMSVFWMIASVVCFVLDVVER